MAKMATPAYNIRDILRERVAGPVDLQESIDRKYFPEVREELVRAAAEAAIQSVSETDPDPSRSAAYEAARIALGLTPLPAQEGEQ